MKQQKLLKTMMLGLLAMVGVSAWAGDFIDDATKVELTHSSGSKTDITSALVTTSGKKSFTFTPTSGNDATIEFTFSSGKSVTAGQIFGVIEYSGTQSATNKCRFRNFTFDTTELEEKDAGTTIAFTINGNTVVLCPFLQSDNVTATKVLKTYYKNNVDETSLNLKYAKVYMGHNGSEEYSVKRVGIYTLGEILELYSDLKAKNWQITDQYQLKNGNCIALGDGVTASATNNNKTDGTGNGVIEANGDNYITTLAGCKLWLKALDLSKIPANYQYFWLRRLAPSDKVSTKDLFASMSASATLMLSFGTGSTNPHALVYLPTKHKKLIDFDRKMFNYTFVDGTAPSSIHKVEGKNLGISSSSDYNKNYATYSRELKAGYNSCLMPFTKFASASDIPTGISFYKVSSLTDGKVIFTKIEDPTANNTFINGTTWYPVIIKANTAGVYTFIGRDAVQSDNALSGYSGYKSSTIADNLYWVGSFEEEAPMADGKTYNGYTCYGIEKNGSKFIPMTSTTNTTYYRAFIADNRAPGARELSLGFDEGDGTTEIVSLKDVHGLEMQNGNVYNLQGVLMNSENLPRGIYVKNGKKFIVK